MLSLIALALTLYQVEPTSLQQDRQAILAMAGTYEVDFLFNETVAFDMDYVRHDDEKAEALELVEVVESSPKKIVLQHLLQTSQGIVKHWRQDWEYENNRLLEFQGEHTWRWRELPAEAVKGTWTQRVFQVDDSPRYEAIGSWNHLGNLSEWRSNLTQRPLPRRESKRDDYNILLAYNIHALTANGWVHEQHNTKLSRTEKGDKALVRELGLNRYRLTRADRAEQARTWWRDHQAFWAEVRQQWARALDQAAAVSLEHKVDGKTLFAKLNELEEQKGDAAARTKAIATALTTYVKSADSVASLN